MNQVRPKIMAKVQAGKEAVLEPEESRDVLAMIHALGKHEKKAIKDDAIIARQTSEVAECRQTVKELEKRVADERRGVRDSFVAAAIAAGKTAAEAFAIADEAMELRHPKKNTEAKP